MAEIRDADVSSTRFSVVATLIFCAAVVGIACACDKTYRRWLKENHPFAGPRARLERLSADYQERRANVTEVAQVIGSALDEVAPARGSLRLGTP